MYSDLLKQLLLPTVGVGLVATGTLFIYMSTHGVKLWLRWLVCVALCALLFGIIGAIRYDRWAFGFTIGLIAGILAAIAADRRELLDLFRK